MKKLLFVCLAAALSLSVGTLSAKNDKKAKTVTTVFVTDIDCDHCAERIMTNIPFEKGVKDVKVDVPSKKVTVVYDATKNTDEGLIKGFSKIRVKAEVSAPETPQQ
ncbi:heavy-metal-associated domain-containing protein [uncultured Alistipes sp.]|uniref:heavy-metal-associated domain-containing protein n=1 Tax=uncultured Alistipes sp. TaxID=538949 RepID=UPI0026280AA3|nr:heavy-metal-associated domain-containing protein [uncultured Alistipes sp.]